MPLLLRSLAPTLIAALIYACLALFVTNSYYQLTLTLVLPTQLQNAAIFVVFLLIIFLRPQGFFGHVVERT